MGVTTAPGLYLRAAALMAANRGVSLRLIPASGTVDRRSTVTRGSLILALISLMNSSAFTPGSRRQSRVASLADGITLAFGGSPTPALRVVREIVLPRIAEVNLF